MNTWKVISVLFFSASVMAVECNITFVKAPCWQDYQVHLDVYDNSNDNKIVEIDLPKSELWTRKSFECQPSQSFSLTTHFSPAIWQGDDKKIFKGKNMYLLPAVEPVKGTIWSIKVCYPSHFASVPLPNKAQNSCDCDYKNIPPLKNENVVKN